METDIYEAVAKCQSKVEKILDYFEFSSQESKEEKMTSNLWMRKENIIKPG